ncbi:hypothetical protein J1N35_024346 [Gossypium stocksii]|uniref:Uncharacterized protein n=1 Tax=Gossypium stocksii TaxID=47602 RepID=A0A9D3ZX96_9ROSI|nr:hypothetical protein J1N35_024346 [Gossypium stocksii]
MIGTTPGCPSVHGIQKSYKTISTAFARVGTSINRTIANNPRQGSCGSIR